MRGFFLIVLRWMALVAVFMVLYLLAGSVTSPPELISMQTPQAQRGVAAMLPLVSLLFSSVLTYLALRSRWHGWRLVGALFTIFYGIYTFLSQIETAAFPAVANQLPNGTLSGFFLAGLIIALPYSMLTVWILGRTRRQRLSSAPRLDMPPKTWIWKLGIAAILYVIVYFVFGYYVAWRAPGLPEFYGGRDPGTFLAQLLDIARESAWLPLLQVARGLIWAAIGSIIISMHRGKVWEISAAVGITFATLISAGLLFPNPFIPPHVARAHAVELTTSMLLYGVLLTMLMLWKPAGRPPAVKEAPNVN